MLLMKGEIRMLFLCYDKCSTCKKVEKKLNELNIQFEKQSIIDHVPSKETLLEILRSMDKPQKLFNTCGKKYRELDLKNKIKEMSLEQMADILSTDGMLIKRPLLITNQKVLIGYKEEEYEALK